MKNQILLLPPEIDNVKLKNKTGKHGSNKISYFAMLFNAAALNGRYRGATALRLISTMKIRVLD